MARQHVTIIWPRSTASWCMWDRFLWDASTLRMDDCSRPLTLTQTGDVLRSLYRAAHS